MRTRSWDAISSVTGRFWLLGRDGVWEQVTEADYMAAERAAGFNAPDGKVATASFRNDRLSLAGTTLRPATSDTTQEKT